MEYKKSENAIIQKTVKYLFTRVLCLFVIIALHSLVLFNTISIRQPISIIVLLAAAAAWLASWTGVIRMAVKYRDDAYLQSAFKDEYFVHIRIKAGYNAFIAMAAACASFILLYLLDTAFPPILAVELIFFAGLSVFDLSTLLQVRKVDE